MSKTTGKTKSKSKTQMRDVITGDSITVGGVTFPIPALDDLPRSVRRRVRQAQVKYMTPSQTDRSGNRFDVYGLGLEVGEMIAAHHGADIDLDDDTLSIKAADEQDAVVSTLGLRVLASQVKTDEDDEGAEGKNAVAASE